MPIAAPADKRKLVIAGVAGVAASGLFAVLLVQHWSEVSGALHAIPFGILLALAALQTAIYLCRVSSWNIALRSSSAHICEHRVRGASGVSFAVSLVLPGYVGAAVRVGLLRRLGRESDVRIGQLAMVDVLALAVEGVILFAIAIPLVAIFAPGYLWLPIGLLVALTAGFALLGPLRAKLGHLSWARSLEVVRCPRKLALFSLPLLGVVIISPLRFWLALTALGVPASIGLAVVSFIIVSIVAALPIGGTQAGIGGLGVLFASHGTHVVLSAGVILAATAAIGAALYFLAIAAIWVSHRMRTPTLASQPA